MYNTGEAQQPYAVGSNATRSAGASEFRAGRPGVTSGLSTSRPEGFLPPHFCHTRERMRTRYGARVNYTPFAIKDQCAYTTTHPDPRTSNGSSILTRPSAAHHRNESCLLHQLLFQRAEYISADGQA